MVWGWAAPPLTHIVPRLTKKRESRRDRLHDFSGVEKSWIYDFISMYWDSTRDAHVSKTIGITTATHSAQLGLLEHPIILSKLHVRVSRAGKGSELIWFTVSHAG